MTDIFLEDRPRNKQGCLRLVLVALAIMLVGWLVIKGCTGKEKPDGEASAPIEGVLAPETDPAGTPAASGGGSTKSGTPAALPDPSGPDRSGPLLADAKRFYEQRDLENARKKGFAALDMATSEEGQQQVEAFLGNLNVEMLFSPVPMEEKVDYTIKSGDIIGKLALTYKTTSELITKGNNIRDARRIRVGDNLRIFNGTFKILVDKSDNTLLVTLNDRFFKRYRVGTGEFNKTPVGSFKVKDRIVEPDWWQPNGQKISYGDPEHLIGTRWLGLNIRGYGIHGIRADYADTIGKQMSAGCIRMLNAEVEEIHIYTPTETEVVIQD
ncbi:MAG: LysM repeat protein [Kiritimatiellia bacterium]|jgi:LysM repeat protein